MDIQLTGHNVNDLDQLLGQLRQAGQKPDSALLDLVKAYGQEAVRPLIEMAVDEKLHFGEQDSPEVWAPIHAIKLLGELEAPEAVEPLLPLFEWDDEWLSTTLPEAFGSIGEPAFAPMRTLLFDRGRGIWARVRAAEALSQIGQRHSELRPEVVNTLVARLDPTESQVPDDEMLNAFVISGLADLKAVEAAPVIRQAFDEDRVDTLVVDLDHILRKLGLPSDSRTTRPIEEEGMRLRLRCTACGYERDHNVGTVYCDIPTMERRQKGEETPYSEFVITRRITCPKCGVVDQYELSSQAYIALVAELVKKMAAHRLGERGAETSEDDRLVFLHFTLSDGREMHPLAAREMYRQQVAAEPNRADLRVRYANVLRFLGYEEEAAEQYRAALGIDPADIEAYLNLGNLSLENGNLEEARRMFERVLAQAPSSQLPSGTRADYVRAAQEAISGLRGLLPTDQPRKSQPLSRLSGQERQLSHGRVANVVPPRQPARKAHKVGRNDPCPCGSGKKYKKCHGR